MNRGTTHSLLVYIVFNLCLVNLNYDHWLSNKLRTECQKNCPDILGIYLTSGMFKLYVNVCSCHGRGNRLRSLVYVSFVTLLTRKWRNDRLVT